MGWIFYQVVKVFLLVVMPFIFLIRGAVFFHESYHLMPSLAIAGGAMATVVLLFIYLSFLYGKMTGRWGGSGVLKRRGAIAFLLVLVYSMHGLLFISGANTKGSEVQKEFTSLHPILRLSISTILFIDKDLMVTDASRAPEDYKKMGLSRKKQSLHYPQKDGYVHAVDIRVKGRSEFRNSLLKMYFSLMGLNTLRHVGSADHLHVSLMSHDRPGAI